MWKCYFSNHRRLSIKYANCHELIDRSDSDFRCIWRSRQAGKRSLRPPRKSPPRLRQRLPLPSLQSRHGAMQLANKCVFVIELTTPVCSVRLDLFSKSVTHQETGATRPL